MSTHRIVKIKLAGALCAILSLLTIFYAHAQTATPAWTFVSSPDWFNTDIGDLSGATPGVPEAEGWDLDVQQGLNGISPQMLQVYDFLIGEMSTYSPEVFVVAGDLINGRWFNNLTLDMFDPDTRNRGTAIDNAGDIYFAWYRWLFDRHGITPVIAAIGDHEIGDDDWPVGSEKSLQVQNMKRVFGRNMVDTLGLPASINGADARPYGTRFEDGSYAYQHQNLLFVAVDMWRQDDPDTEIHARYGSVSPEVSGAHLMWLDELLTAADHDPTIDHVIIQGHPPVLRPVRMQRTSGTMVVNREDSDFWQLLRQHDHRHGGKVRIYFSGEVHAVTVSKDPQSDIIQLVHGKPPRGALVDEPIGGNYMVFTVHPDRIEAESRRFVLEEDGTSLFWQASDPQSSGPSAAMSSIRSGSLVVDTSAAETRYTASGDMDLVDQTGLTLHFGFDETTASGDFSNTGSIGNDAFYAGVANGALRTGPGMFGSALELDGTSAFLESGRGNITEGESRTVSAWVKSTAQATQTVLGYGRDKFNSDLNGRFNFQLASGRLRLNISADKNCLADGAPQVADGAWHHVAVVLTDKHDNRCADTIYYVDGAEFAAGADNATARFATQPISNFRIGAGGKGSSVTDLFTGTIDDVAIWGSPLSSAKTRAIATVGSHAALRYDAFYMELLFDLFDAQQGEVNIGGLAWMYITGLNGAGGDVLDLGDRIAIQLDNSGNGVAAGLPSPQPVYEAELAARSAEFRVTDRHSGFTGSGYVDYVGEGYVEWTVNVATTGTHDLVFRYALDSANRPLRILVDGTTLASTLDFPTTGSWENWGEVQINATLTAGAHTIRAQTTGVSGANMDHLRLESQTPPPPQTLYEAELAARSAEFRVADRHSGFTGSGYVDYVGEGYVEWTVNVATTGTHDLVFRYALDSANRPLRILVDGTTLASTLDFPTTGSWENWGEVQINATLTAGAHTIRAQTTGVSGANMDHLRLESQTPPPPQTLYEAELAARSAEFRVADRHSGFTGSGYVDYVGEGYVEWTVNVATTGTHDLVFRYALDSANRPLRILVDGTTLASTLDFPTTGSWENWGEVQINATLTAGAHTIRAQTTGVSGANMDHLAVQTVP